MCNLHFDSFRAVHRGSPSSVDTTLVAGTKTVFSKFLGLKMMHGQKYILPRENDISK